MDAGSSIQRPTLPWEQALSYGLNYRYLRLPPMIHLPGTLVTQCVCSPFSLEMTTPSEEFPYTEDPGQKAAEAEAGVGRMMDLIINLLMRWARPDLL